MFVVFIILQCLNGGDPEIFDLEKAEEIFLELERIRGLKMSLWQPLAATCDDTCVRRKRRNRETVFASGLLRAPLPPLTSSALTRPRHAGFAPSSVSPYRCRTTASRNAAPTCARWRRGRRKAPSCRARRTFRRNASACAETDGKTVFFLRPQMSNKRFQTLR